MVRFFTEDVGEGDVIFDIGANVGAYSLIAASEFGKAISVLAFEPCPATYAALVSNIRINGLSDVIQAYPLAFGAKTKVDVFNQSSIIPGSAEHAVGSAIDFRGNVFEPAFQHSVMCFNLDTFVEFFKVKPPTHIKIDVDGIELDILRGAKKVLAMKCLRKVSVEVREGSPEEGPILHLMESGGFSVSRGDILVNSGCINYVFQR